MVDPTFREIKAILIARLEETLRDLRNSPTQSGLGPVKERDGLIRSLSRTLEWAQLWKEAP